MTDTKITRILMNMATVEDGIAKGHEAKAALLRELASNIEFPNQEHGNAKNPKPTPNLDTNISVKPKHEIDPWDEVEKEFGRLLGSWLKRQ